MANQMVNKPHIVSVVAGEARRQFFRQRRAGHPCPRIREDEIGVEFEDGRFIPYADLGYHGDIGFFRLSETADVPNEAAPYAAPGRLVEPGQIMVTPGIAQRLTNDEIRDLLARHTSGDFGDYGEFYDLDVTDEMLRDQSNRALTPGLLSKVNALTGLNPVASAYTVREHRVWVITEAGEKPTTTLLYAGPVID